jgi:prepilin-type N-terminal cleavage/methylation domain-containing protein
MKKGFTLIELMVVIAVIGIFSTLILASINATKEKRGNYKICFDNSCYYVESYTKENQGQCIFLSDNNKRFCGNWSAEKLNIETNY